MNSVGFLKESRKRMKEMLKLYPVYKDHLCDNQRLRQKYNKVGNTTMIAKTWELSIYRNGGCQKQMESDMDNQFVLFACEYFTVERFQVVACTFFKVVM